MPADTSWHRHLPPGVDPREFDLSALAVGGTLPAVWQANWSADPKRAVLHDTAHGWLTAGQLAQSVGRCAERLGELGVSAGDRVLLSAANCAELVVAHVALLCMGAVVVPINPSYRRNELTHIVQSANPAAALLADDIRDEWREWISASAASVAVPAWSQTVAVHKSDGPAANTAAAPLAPQDGALLIYTSGSTGSPKAALLSHANLLASVRAIELAWRWTNDDVLLLTLPLSHMHGLGVGLYGTLTAAAKVVIHDAFEAAAVLDAIAAHGATMFFGVPTIYARLLESDRLGELAKPRAATSPGLRLCVSGSAALPAQAHSNFAERTGLQVLERYGMTETAMLVSNPYDGERRPGTIGFPLPGVQLRLDEDTREILVRGPNVFAGYWQARSQAGADAQASTASGTAFQDGWFRTGDIGQISPDGYVSIVGRSKEIIISGGYNIHPREIEEAIALHPGVAECAVAGEADAKWGEVVAVYVVPNAASAAEPSTDEPSTDETGPARPGTDEPGNPGAVDLAELRSFLDGTLAHYKRPQRCYIVAELPRNALGKVQRHLLTGSAG